MFTHVPTRQISDEEVREIEEPTLGGTGLLDAAFDEDVEETEEETFTKLDQLSSEIETLSLVPKSRWQTLVHLDTIKVCCPNSISCQVMTGHSNVISPEKRQNCRRKRLFSSEL